MWRLCWITQGLNLLCLTSKGFCITLSYLLTESVLPLSIKSPGGHCSEEENLLALWVHAGQLVCVLYNIFYIYFLIKYPSLFYQHLFHHLKVLIKVYWNVFTLMLLHNKFLTLGLLFFSILSVISIIYNSVRYEKEVDSGVMVVIGNGYNNQSSKPGWGCFHFT